MVGCPGPLEAAPQCSPLVPLISLLLEVYLLLDQSRLCVEGGGGGVDSNWPSYFKS